MGLHSGHDLLQLGGLLKQQLCGLGRLIYQLRIFLGHAIKLFNRATGLKQISGLIFSQCAELVNLLRDGGGVLNHGLHAVARIAHQCGCIGRLAQGVLDELPHVASCFSAALRQAAHFARNDREAFAMLTGARRFYSCVQSQDIGLKGYRIDQTHDVSNFSGTVMNGFHGSDHLADQRTTGLCVVRSLAGDVTCLLRFLGAFLRIAFDAQHVRRSLLQVGSSVLGALLQMVVALRNARGTLQDYISCGPGLRHYVVKL